MEKDLSVLDEKQEELLSTVERLRAAYESEWDDPVHDSYELYVAESTRYINSIVDFMNRIPKLYYDCESINIDDVRKEFEVISKEVSGL